MTLPGLDFNIEDGGLGRLSPNAAKTQLKLGISLGGNCNELYTFNSPVSAKSTLVGGPLCSAVLDALAEGGGPVLAIKMNPGTGGTVGSTTLSGTGLATVVGSAKPWVKISLVVVTGGALGTMTHRIKLGDGTYGALYTSTVTTYTLQVPGTLTSLSFAAGTYVAADEYIWFTDGTVTTPAGPPPAITPTSYAGDHYRMALKVVTAGALGTAQFQLSLNDDASNLTPTYGATITTPSGGIYVVPNTGVILTLSTGPGNFVVDDVYRFQCRPAGYTNTDFATAYAIAQADDSAQWGTLHVVDPKPVSAGVYTAAAAASLAGAVDAQLAVDEAAQRFTRGLVECPTWGTGESVATVKAAFVAFESTRVGVAVGDCEIDDFVTNCTMRRVGALPASSRATLAPEAQKLSWVGGGALSRVRQLYYNEQTSSSGYDSARFLTLRSFPGKVGYFVTRPRIMADPTSDFLFFERGRVMDRACVVARDTLAPQVEGSVRVDRTTGFINEEDAQAIEKNCQAALDADLVARGQASATIVTVSRTENILASENLPVDIGVIGLGYSGTLTINIGYQNPLTA